MAIRLRKDGTWFSDDPLPEPGSDIVSTRSRSKNMSDVGEGTIPSNDEVIISNTQCNENI